MTECINVIENKSVNIYKNMLYNSRESYNISIFKGKKPLDIKIVELECDLQVSSKSRSLLPGRSRVRDLAEATGHTGPNDSKAPS